MKYYTRKEIARHNKKTDCWLIANNNVGSIARDELELHSFLNNLER